MSQTARPRTITPILRHAMTEQTLSAITPTPLAAALEPAPPVLAPYRGVLTPLHFAPSASSLSEPVPSKLDAPEAEIAALFEGAAVHDLGWQRRITVRGEDRARWLSGMVTNAVESLPSHSGAYNLILNAQGRIQGDALVWHKSGSEGSATDSEFELELEAAQSEALLAHLDQFIIMDDVELLPLSDLTALGLTGPTAPVLLAALGLPIPDADLSYTEATLDDLAIRITRYHSPLVPRFSLWIDEGKVHSLWNRILISGATAAGSAALETLRILEGTPAYAQDIQSRDLAQETSLTRALNFTKGCYLGQEIVERIRSRGQVHRHLRQLEILPAESSPEIPTPGTELQLNGKPAGTLTSVARVQLHSAQRIFAIGMIRAEAELTERSGTHLDYAGGHVRLLATPPRLTDS